MDFFNFGYNIEYKGDYISIKIPEYLKLISKLNDSNLKLVNQNVFSGIVYVFYNRFVYILRLHLEMILLDKIKNMKSVDHIILESNYNEMLLEIKNKYEIKMLPRLDIVNKSLPPCIDFIIQKVDKEHYLSHTERILISTFMFSKQYDEDWLIENVFCKLSDWDERVTKYQLKSIKKLMVMGCDKIESNGLCKKENDRLNRCNKIRNPFNF